MKINISGKNVTITDALKDYARKKVGKIKDFDGDLEARLR